MMWISFLLPFAVVGAIPLWQNGCVEETVVSTHPQGTTIGMRSVSYNHACAQLCDQVDRCHVSSFDPETGDCHLNPDRGTLTPVSPYRKGRTIDKDCTEQHTNGCWYGFTEFVGVTVRRTLTADENECIHKCKGVSRCNIISFHAGSRVCRMMASGAPRMSQGYLSYVLGCPRKDEYNVCFYWGMTPVGTFLKEFEAIKDEYVCVNLCQSVENCVSINYDPRYRRCELFSSITALSVTRYNIGADLNCKFPAYSAMIRDVFPVGEASYIVAGGNLKECAKKCEIWYGCKIWAYNYNTHDNMNKLCKLFIRYTELEYSYGAYSSTQPWLL